MNGATQRTVKPGVYQALAGAHAGQFFFEERVAPGQRSRKVKRYAATVQRCQAKRREFFAAVARGEEQSVSDRQTLGLFVEREFFPHVKETRAETTLRGYRSHWRCHIEPALAERPVAAVTPFEVQDLLDGMAKQGVGKKTRLEVYNLLGAVFALWGKRKRQARERVVSPMGEVDRPQYEAPEKPYLQEADYSRLVEAFDPWWLPLLIVASITTARIAEVLSIQWRDIEFEGGEPVRLLIQRGLEGRPKSKKHRRTRRVTPELAAAVWALRRQFVQAQGREPHDDETLFCWPGAGDEKVWCGGIVDPEVNAGATAKGRRAVGQREDRPAGACPSPPHPGSEQKRGRGRPAIPPVGLVVASSDPTIDQRDRLRVEVWYAALDRAGLPRRPRESGWNLLRHTALTEAVRNYDPKTAQAISGHAKADKLLDVYAHKKDQVAEADAADHSTRFGGLAAQRLSQPDQKPQEAA